MIESRARSPLPAGARPAPSMANTPHSGSEGRTPSAGEVVLLTGALSACAWLVALANGAAAAGLTFAVLSGLNVAFLLARQRRSSAPRPQPAPNPPEIEEL